MTKQPERYDVIVIGAGPAGYVAAIRCAQLNLRVACVDDWVDKNGVAALGGTCVNAGCIPSKALLDSSELFSTIHDGLGGQGIKIKGIELDLAAMIDHKDKVVSQYTRHIAALFEQYKIKTFNGRGKLLDDKRVEISPLNQAKKAKMIAAENIILAAGSSPMEVAMAPVDGEYIVDSTGALNFDNVPKKLGIIGAGIVGSELGSIWSRLGSKVTLLEAQDKFLTIADEQIADEALREYRKQGLDVRLGCRVTSAEKTAKQVTLHYEDQRGSHRLLLDRLIVAVGRKPNSDELFAAEADILLDERGFIHTDEQCMTSIPGVYAVGDLCHGPMLAHKGIKEGILAAEVIVGNDAEMNYDLIPSVIYTEPEIAWVGQTETGLRAAGEDIKVGVAPYCSNSRSIAMEKPSGLVKIIAAASTDKILGVHIIGNSASELIAEAALAMEFSASSEDLAQTIHAHPTLAELMHEAALAVDNRALYT